MSEDEIKRMIEEWMPEHKDDRLVFILCREIERQTRHNFRSTMNQALFMADQKIRLVDEMDDLNRRRMADTEASDE